MVKIRVQETWLKGHKLLEALLKVSVRRVLYALHHRDMPAHAPAVPAYL
jgi:hypothetical protein